MVRGAGVLTEIKDVITTEPSKKYAYKSSVVSQ